MKLAVPSKDVEQPDLLPNYDNELTVVIAGLPLGGAERMVFDWASRVYPRWRAHIIALRDHDKEWPVPDFIGVTRLHNKQIIEKLRALGAKIAGGRNPVCLCHLLRREERDALSAEGVFTIPVLQNARAGWLEDASRLENSPYAIAVSEACAEDLRESGYQGNISVIRHIPPSRIFAPGSREYFRRTWRIPGNAIVIGMIGAVKPQKNYTFALRVLKAMHRERDAYLVILGGPIGRNGRTAWEAVIEEIHRLNLRYRVAMPGFVAEAAKCLQAFDVMLNTSSYEGLSMATLEALVNGLRVVASKVGGQGEIEHEGLKLISEGASEEVWVDALNEALRSKTAVPSWIRFPAYRLWTLSQLSRPVEANAKVLFVTANLNSGGAQRSLVNLAKSLKRKITFEIAVCGNSTASFFSRELKKSKIKFFRTADSKDAFDHSEMLIKKICSGNFGTVCFWNLDPKIKLLLTKTLGFTKIRFVDVSPGNYSFDEMEDITEFQKFVCFDSSEYYRRLDVLVFKYRDICVSRFKNCTAVIPNGVPRPVAMKLDYSVGSHPRVAVSGRIAPNKFLVEIIEAMKIVWNILPEAELHIFGAAEPRHADYAAKVMEAAKDELNKRIFFHGLDFEAASHLHDFDAFVVLGKNQGCPNALLEALAVGLPTVANDDGGTGEQIIHGQTGLLTKSCSPEEVAGALSKILTDRELAEKLGRNARKHVLENFSMEQMAEKYLSLLEEKQPAREKFWRRVFRAIGSSRLFLPKYRHWQ